MPVKQICRISVFGGFFAFFVLPLSLFALPAVDSPSDSGQSFRYEVWGKTTQSNSEEKWSESYPTPEEATARMKEIYQDHAKGGLLETDPRHPVGLYVRKIPTGTKPDNDDKKDKDKLTKEAEDAAKKAKKAVDKAIDETKAGAGELLKKYKDAVSDAYQRAKATKDAQSGKVKNLSKYELDQANKVIADYNKARMNYGNLPKASVAPLLAKYPAMSPLSAADKPSQTQGKYTVEVYKRISGDWQKQDDRTYNTDDEDKGRKYMNGVNAVAGWKATSNLPEDKKDDDLASKLKGTSWGGTYGNRQSGETYGTIQISFNADGSIRKRACNRFDKGRPQYFSGTLDNAGSSQINLNYKENGQDKTYNATYTIQGDTMVSESSDGGYETLQKNRAPEY